VKRRELIKFATALAAGTVTGLPSVAASDTWKASFAQALKQKPWLLGFASVRQPHYQAQALQMSGELPSGLRGVFYRNGPAGHEVGDQRYHHWFDGDGMVQAFRFTDQGIFHTGRMVETSKYQSEQLAGVATEAAFATELAGVRAARSADQINTANISVIKHGGELLALWEGGSAHRLDPLTLETLGLKSWSDETEGLPFSAHPRVDQDGTLWSFGYAPISNALVLYRISAKGELVDQALIRVDEMPMVHDFLITGRHIVLVLPPYAMDVSKEGAFMERFSWNSNQPGRAMVISKETMSLVKMFDIPAFWAFHYSNAWEDASGKIRFEFARYKDSSVMTESFSSVMKGEWEPNPSQFVAATLDVKNSKFDSQVVAEMDGAEFPEIDQRMQARAHSDVYTVKSTDTAKHPISNAVSGFNRSSGSVSSHVFSPDTIAEEHVFVPDSDHPGSEKGWLVGTSLDTKQGVTRVQVFDSHRIADGPVAVASLSYPLPLGFHGYFASDS